MPEKLDEETHYQLLKYLDENPNVSQRELAKKMGVSLGKVNYCLKALIDVGQVKLNNFTNSQNKSGYLYLLTPSGVKEKSKVAMRFLTLKQQQYDEIQKEIASLQREISLNKSANDS